MDGWRVPLDERRGYIGGSKVRRAVRRRWRTCVSWGGRSVVAVRFDSNPKKKKKEEKWGFRAWQGSQKIRWVLLKKEGSVLTCLFVEFDFAV